MQIKIKAPRGTAIHAGIGANAGIAGTGAIAKAGLAIRAAGMVVATRWRAGGCPSASMENTETILPWRAGTRFPNDSTGANGGTMAGAVSAMIAMRGTKAMEGWIVSIPIPTCPLNRLPPVREPGLMTFTACPWPSFFPSRNPRVSPNTPE